MRQSGYTLLELLIVAAILMLLMAALSGGYSVVQSRARSRAAKLEVGRLALALGQYQQAWGDYPPSSLRWYKLQTNGQNDGAESMVAHLARKGRGGPWFQFDEGRLVNQDKDKLPDNDLGLGFASGEALEYQDLWGHPYLYLHSRDYTDPKAAGVYLVGEQKTVMQAALSAKTGEYQGAYSFQLWSCGPDGKNNQGAGDDIPSW